MGRGPWDVPWTSLQKFLRTHQCIPHHTPPCHIYIYIWLHFWIGFWSLGATRRFLMVEPPLKYTCTLWVLHTFLKLSLSSLLYGTAMCGFWMLSVPVFFLLLLLFFWVWLLDLILMLLKAHAGYLHFVRALFRWSSSCFNSWGLEQMVFTLWYRVPITLNSDGNVWQLSYCRYRSVCMGFLYTVVLRLPSSFGITNILRKGMDPSSLCSSLVNWICWSMELMWSKKALLCDDLMMVNVSSTYLFKR